MKRALLIVDVQNGFITDKTKHIPSLVEKLQYDYDIVFITKFINKHNPLFRILLNYNKLKPEDEEDIKLAFKPKQDSIIIDKHNYSCVDDNFLNLLKQNNINKIDVCGIETDVCVTKCAVDLFENEIMPFVLKDYCATNSEMYFANDIALEMLKRYIGEKQII